MSMYRSIGVVIYNFVILELTVYVCCGLGFWDFGLLDE